MRHGGKKYIYIYSDHLYGNINITKFNFLVKKVNFNVCEQLKVKFTN